MNYIRPSNNSRSTSPSPYNPKNPNFRPSNQEPSLRTGSLTSKQYQNDFYKTKGSNLTTKDPTPPKAQKNNGRSIHPKSDNSIIYESATHSFIYEDMLNSTYYKGDNKRNRSQEEDKDLRENKFKTLNARGDYSTIYNPDDRARTIKMNTITPQDYSSRDFKQKILEHITKKYNNKLEYHKTSLETGQPPKIPKDHSLNKNRGKDPAYDTLTFPTISYPKNNEQTPTFISGKNEILLEHHVGPLPPKIVHTRDASVLKVDDYRRTKSS